MGCRGPWRIAIAALAIALSLEARAIAHVGSPDVFVEAQAGPYRLFVTVRPPHAIPGVADVEVLATSDDIHDVRIVPLPLTGPGAQFAPVADRAVPTPDSPRLFTGHLWLMSAGAWQVRVTVTGDRGEGTLSVPVPTLPQSTLAMNPVVRAILIGLMVLLAAGFVGIVSALAREAGLDANQPIDRRAQWRGRIAGTAATVLVVGIVFLGNMWWSAEASSYDRYVYKPLIGTPAITPDARLRLTLTDPGWIGSRRLDDFVPDHGHLMHLFVVSPSLDRLWHLHPDEAATGVFTQQLPDMSAGRYELFADVVHATGVSETVTGQFEAEDIHGAPLSGDDSAWPPSPQGGFGAPGTPDGSGHIVWQRGDEPLVPKRLTLFTFRVEDGNRQPAHDLELYMGMPGHAIFVRKDLKVFAHVHPSGSAPMAAMDIAMTGSTGSAGSIGSTGSAHAQHQTAETSSTVTFPFGFPEPGAYRIFVQVKRAGHVVTGVFDADVK